MKVEGGVVLPLQGVLSAAVCPTHYHKGFCPGDYKTAGVMSVYPTQSLDSKERRGSDHDY